MKYGLATRCVDVSDNITVVFKNMTSLKSWLAKYLINNPNLVVEYDIVYLDNNCDELDKPRLHFPCDKGI